MEPMWLVSGGVLAESKASATVTTRKSMYEKAGKFYADWYAKDGTRKRKSFKSARAALLFEAEQKEIAHPKTRASGKQLLHSYSRKLGASRAETRSTKAQSSSSLRLVPSHPNNSARPTLPKLTKASKGKTTRTQQNRARRER